MAILIKETTSLFSLTLETGNKSLVRSIIFLSQKTRNQNKRWTGFNNNLDFDDCTHEYTELPVYWMILARKLNMLKNVLSFKKMRILFVINSFTCLDLPTSITCKSGGFEKKSRKTWRLGPQTWRFPKYTSNLKKKTDYLFECFFFTFRW